MSTVDVIVPCYRYGRFLRHCVTGVLQQEGVDVRVLVIDDASLDETADVAQGLAREDARVTFIRHVVNRGHIETYNEGLEWVSGDHCLLLSADDYLLPGALARANAVFAAHPEVVLTCGRALVAYEGQPLPAAPARPDLHHSVVSGAAFIERVCGDSAENPVYTPTAVVRTAAQKAVGGYSKVLPHAADLHMWLRLARLGSVAFLQAYQAVYRRHGANMHYSYVGVPNLQQHLVALETALDGYEGREGPAPLRARYRRGLALGAVRAANDALNDNDRPRYAEAVDFALSLDAGVTNTTAWRLMQLRRALGYRLVNHLRRDLGPAVRKLRTVAVRAESLRRGRA